MKFEPGYDRTHTYTEVHYSPADGALRRGDVRLITAELSRCFGTDFPVHVEEKDADRMRSYDSLSGFLTRPGSADERLVRVDFLLPVGGETYSFSIEPGKNRISIWYQHNDPDEKYDFTQVMQHVFRLLTKAGDGDRPAFVRQTETVTLPDRKKSALRFFLTPRLEPKHDLPALAFFDREFHPGTIYTRVWDYEEMERAWRRFEGFEAYRREAPADVEYRNLSEAAFDLTLRGIQYRVRLCFDSLPESVRIEFTGDLQSACDFTPLLARLEKALA